MSMSDVRRLLDVIAALEKRVAALEAKRAQPKAEKPAQ